MEGHRLTQRRKWLLLLPFVAFGNREAWAQRVNTAGAERRISIGVVGDSVSGARPNRGIILGTEEAAHTARMFEWEVVVVRPPDSLSAADAVRHLAQLGVTAIVGDFSGTTLPLSGEVSRPLVFDIGQSFRTAERRCGDAPLRVLPLRDSARLATAGNRAQGIKRIAWHSSLERYGAGQLNDRFRARFGDDMDERAWAGWMATKILIDAVLKTGTTNARKLKSQLTDKTGFDGYKGVPLYFDPETRELVQPLFYLTEAGELEEVTASSRESSSARVSANAARCGIS